MSFENISLGRGIIKEVEPIEQLLRNIEKSLDTTLETARKYWPDLF